MKTESIQGYQYVLPSYYADINKKEWGSSKKLEAGSIRLDLARSIILSAILLAPVKAILEQNAKDKAKGSKEIIKSKDAGRLGVLISKINANVNKAFELLVDMAKLRKTFSKTSDKNSCLKAIQLLLSDCSHNYQSLIEIIGTHNKEDAKKLSDGLETAIELINKIDNGFLMEAMTKEGFMQNVYSMLVKKLSEGADKEITLSQVQVTAGTAQAFSLTAELVQNIFASVRQGISYLKAKPQAATDNIVTSENNTVPSISVPSPAPKKFDPSREGKGYGIHTQSQLFFARLRRKTDSETAETADGKNKDEEIASLSSEVERGRSNTTGSPVIGRQSTNFSNLDDIIAEIEQTCNLTPRVLPESKKLTS